MADLTDTQRKRLAQVRFAQLAIPNNKGKYAMGADGQEGDRELAALGLVENSCSWEPFKFVRLTKAGYEAIKDYWPRRWTPGSDWRLGEPDE